MNTKNWRNRFIGLFILGAGAPSLAFATTCIVRKSLVKFDPDTGQLTVRKAETPSFQVSVEEHETPYSIDFVETNGATWGSVEVMTGTLFGSDDGDLIQANATIQKEDGSILANITLLTGLDSRFAKALTQVDLPDTDDDPTMTLECRQ